ncbi:tail protein X [Methylobacterium sp. WCS2018Hpa-22]|uniref:tail protein X n=1 Tax=Methylobacterium sp. WCS2018Hpa-22 TaxID=3073633 RepID=UPI00288AE728|nr:tail protein X [Methylobacterium sp. WCS2018Hpa-22]
MTTETETTIEGDTVDIVAMRRRKATDGVTEQILTLNPGLAALGPILPAGIVVKLPATPTKKVVRDVPRIWS